MGAVLIRGDSRGENRVGPVGRGEFRAKDAENAEVEFSWLWAVEIGLTQRRGDAEGDFFGPRISAKASMIFIRPEGLSLIA